MNADLKTLAFDVCLQRLFAGESLDVVLKAYPEWADDFRSMLATAVAARDLGESIQVPRAAMARSRAKFLTAAGARRSVKAGGFAFAALRLALTALVAVFVLAFAGFSTFAASAQTLPGDALYSLKIWSEQARLAATRNPLARMELEHTFDQERLTELNTLIEQSRTAIVNFAGGLQQVGPDTYQVGPVRVLGVAATQWVGDIQVGYYVRVSGVLQSDGEVVATRIAASQVELKGYIQQITPAGWVVDRAMIQVSPDTRIEGLAAVGSQVIINAIVLADHGLLAREIQVVFTPAGAATPTPVTTEVVPSESVEATPEAGDDAGIETVEPEDSTETPEATDVDDNENSNTSITPESTDDDGDDNDTGNDSNDNTGDENDNDDDDDDNDNDGGGGDDDDDDDDDGDDDDNGDSLDA